MTLLPVRQCFLDISNRVVSGGEMGMLGLAFDPDWPATVISMCTTPITLALASVLCSVLSRFTVRQSGSGPQRRIRVE
ncbi:MAG: hypothetical protein R3F38_18980 [Gammaproteobacteria bacterium]